MSERSPCFWERLVNTLFRARNDDPQRNKVFTGRQRDNLARSLDDARQVEPWRRDMKPLLRGPEPEIGGPETGSQRVGARSVHSPISDAEALPPALVV